MKQNISPQNCNNNNPCIKFISEWFERNAPNIKTNWIWMLNEEFTTRVTEEAQFREYFIYISTRWSLAVIITLIFYFVTTTMDSEKKSDPSHYEWLNQLHYRLGIVLSVEKWIFLYWCLFLCMYSMLDIWAWLYVLRHLLFHIFGPI